MNSIPPKFKRVWKSKYFSSKKLAPSSKEAAVPTEEMKSVITEDTQETKVPEDVKSTAGDKESVVVIVDEDDVDLGVIPKFRKPSPKEDEKGDTKGNTKEDTKKDVKKDDEESAEKDTKKDAKKGTKKEAKKVTKGDAKEDAREGDKEVESKGEIESQEGDEDDRISVATAMPWIPHPSPYLYEGPSTTQDIPEPEFKQTTTWQFGARMLFVPTSSSAYNPPLAPWQVSEPTGQLQESAERKSDLDNLEERLEEAMKELEGVEKKQSKNDGTVASFPIKEWEKSTINDPISSLVRTTMYSTSIRKALFSRERGIKDNFQCGLKLTTSNYPIANQHSTGRCWLFTCTNTIRHHLTRSAMLPASAFQFSHSYLSFYDKLEKANHFLENMIELVEKPLNDRLVESIMECPVADSGTWTDAVWLIKKYGLVPESVFPETSMSQSTGTMNELLCTKLREHALKIRTFDPVIRQDLRFADSSDPVIQRKTDEGRRRVLRQLKNYLLREIYNILTVCMGVPPQPSEMFIWEFSAINGKYAFWRGSPLLFREVYVDKGSGLWEDDDPLDTIILLNDPRHEYGKILTGERHHNYQRGETTLLLNVESSVMREAVVKCIMEDYPVPFSSDIDQFSSGSSGLLDVELFEYEKAFGTKFGLTKGERLDCLESAMTHDMLFTGTNLDDQRNVVRFTIENSWGSSSGYGGMCMMTPRWFDEFVYEVVIPRSVAERHFKNLLESLNTADKCVLPYWDPIVRAF
ncbi:hypothetical protein CPB86DRAFT_118048 [Serendipita vermifera]|nr:hypothetical protein CPB86DRAFT_118048 [Serendipita vermifera]